MDELMPCPFCGSTATITYNSLYGFQIYCDNEDCFMNEILITSNIEDEKEAINAWNRRCG